MDKIFIDDGWSVDTDGTWRKQAFMTEEETQALFPSVFYGTTKATTITRKETDKMIDPYIVANFPNTEDAVLVDKWFMRNGHYLPTHPTADYVERLVMEAAVPNWAERVLAKAKELEAEEKAKKNK